MVTSCPICRSVVHVYAGFILTHGSRHHGVFNVCAASRTPICVSADCCG